MSLPDRPLGEQPSSDRLGNESGTAYLAYSHYRDLGLARSIDKAWAVFAATRDTLAKQTAKTSTRWHGWSAKYEWVKRAAAFDAETEAIQRAARVARLIALEERRADYDFANQDRLEQRVGKMEKVLDKADAAPITDVTQSKDETVRGQTTSTKTKIKGINFSGYASLVRQTNETARQAITGVREKTEKPTGESAGEVRRVVWRRADDVDV